MKKVLKRSALILTALFAVLLLSAGETQAAKAVKVTRDSIYRGGKSWSVYTGKTKAGKKVWTYTTKKGVAAQLDYSNFAANKSYVYILDGKTFIKLKLSNGKKVLTKKLKDAPSAGQVLAIDGKGNFYAIAYLDNDNLYKFNSKGKLLWKCDLTSSGVFWYHKIKVGSSKITVYGDGPESWKFGQDKYYVKVNPKTGKMTGYSNPEK